MTHTIKHNRALKALIHIFFTYCIMVLFACCLMISGCRTKTGLQEQASESDANVVKAQWQPIEINASVDKSDPHVGETITYTLTVNAIPEISPKIPEMGSQILGLRIVDIGSDGPRKIDERNQWRRWYKLQADFTGSYIIPPAKVFYKDPQGEEKEVETSNIFIEVKSYVMKEGEEPGDIRDIKPLEEIKDNTFYLYIIAIAVILLLLLICIAIWLWVHKRKKDTKEYIQSPDERALDELEKLKLSDYLQQEDYRAFYFRLSEIFRSYIEERYALPAQESTTEELIPHIEKLNLTRAQKDTVRLLTKWEDLVKFAKHIPSHKKAETHWDETRKLIIQTRKQSFDVNAGKQHLDDNGVPT